MTPRFSISTSGVYSVKYFNIVDDVSDRVIASSLDKKDANFIVVKLNTCQDHSERNPIIAMALEGFRQKLEAENGGPLMDGPELALLLADLCDFCEFNTGERAVALGADLLAYLDRLDNPE